MNIQIGRRVFTIGKSYWTKMKWGIIVGVGNTGRHYIVKYEDGRKAWIKPSEILFWK